MEELVSQFWKKYVENENDYEEKKNLDDKLFANSEKLTKLENLLTFKIYWEVWIYDSKYSVSLL